jgi:hypothetical protein
MLSIDRILEISKEMGVTINESTEGVHYILDHTGKKVIFHTDMLMKTESQTSFQEFELEFPDIFESITLSSVYKPSDGYNSSYFLDPIYIVEANVIAA